jgi:hypothetical protein
MIRAVTVTLTTKMRIASWDESPVEEFGDGSKLTRAQVRLSEAEGGLASGSAGMLAYYRPDGTSSFVTVMRLAGISGTCESVSTHADYPFMPLTLAYELA